MKRNLSKIRPLRLLAALLAAALLPTLGACTDDALDTPVPEGEPTAITLRLRLPETQAFEIGTRADISSRLKNRVNNIWVGIYSKTSGNRLAEFYQDYSNEQPGDHQLREITMTNVKSGECYIMAVANSKNQQALKVTDGTSDDLYTLLHNATTYTDYRALAIEQLEGNVYAPNPSVDAGIVMSGTYYQSASSDPVSWEEVGSVVIPAGGTATNPVTLSGAIHLRLPYSQIKFNIKPAQDVISLDVNSYRVVNVPKYLWVQERRQQDASASNILGFANAGDASDPYFASNKNYNTSYTFTSADMRVTQHAPQGTTPAYNTYEFDFWLPENKRTGREDCTQYEDREKVYTTPIPDAPADNPQLPNQTGTGIYQSLCPEEGSLNNNATFVVLDCDIRYYDTKNSNPGGPIDPSVRTAHAQYIIHMGYLNNNPRDFNTLRNSIYTYNVEVKGVDNILVEAWREGDKQPSASGIVTDTSDAVYNLDAHYHAFNIELTEEELDASDFKFIMETWDSGVKYTYETGDPDMPRSSADPRWKYYDWVKFVKKSDQNSDDNVLEPYPGTASDKIIYADELKGPKGGPGKYTIFVDEYAYENSDGNETAGRWKGYVNQNPRRFWLRVKQNTSYDGESSYYKAKYSIEQQSIQTFYTPDKASLRSALGMEHVNENFGMNVVWYNSSSSPFATDWGITWNANVGRWNLAQIASGKPWSDYLNSSRKQWINEITINKSYNNYYFGSTDAHSENVPQLNVMSIPNFQYGSYNPQEGYSSTSQYYAAPLGCLNRNRDENGNGTIDPEEIKWVLPTSGEMLRMILGEKGLQTPLVNYSRSQLPFTSTYGQNAIYHFATSDNKIIWTEEGLSSSPFAGEGGVTAQSSWNRPPWEIRCVRYLGLDLRNTEDTNTTDLAYEGSTSSDGSALVKVSNYYGSNIREISLDPLPVNKINDYENKLGRYGFEVAPKEFDKKLSYSGYSGTNAFNYYNSDVDNADAAGGICAAVQESTGRTGWRMPNQRELAIMLRLQLLDGGEFISCTQEFWSNTDAVSSSIPGPNFRVMATAPNSTAVARGLTQLSAFQVRCVRDITAAEQNMTLDEIQKQKSAPRKRKAKRATRRSGVYRAADAGLL